MTNLKRLAWLVVGLLIGGSSVVAVDAFAATAKPPAKIDCKNVKNAKKIECAKPPTSDVKAKVKKPVKVTKAPAAVKKKAEENTKK